MGAIEWIVVGKLSDLVPNAGVCARVMGEQIALFYLPDLEQPVYALGNRDPIGQAQVLARGLTGDIKGEPCVASPLYKQHFSLRTGQCLELPDQRVPTWPVKVQGDQVLVSLTVPSA